MATVPRNKGSYAPRTAGSSWQVKYPLGWNERKKRYDEYREEVASEAEAIALIKAINDYVYHGGLPQDVPEWRRRAKGHSEGDVLTLDGFAMSYIAMRERRRKVQERTIESNREAWARLRPYLGDLPLRRVTPFVIDEAYACMGSPGDDNLAGRVYSGTTIEKSHAFLRQLLKDAVERGYIDKNPCDSIDAPKRDTKEKVALTLFQAQALFNYITSRPLEAHAIGVLLALNCGLRLSEMLALTWQDYEGGVLSVTKALNKEKQTYKSTKNEDNRRVPVPMPLIPVLDEWQKIQRRIYSDNLGLRWSEGAPIVNSRNAKHILQRSFTRWFDSARLEYPIPDDFEFHGFRHTYVTLLSRDCGVDRRTAKSMSGHKNDQAFDIYTHTNDEWRRRAANELGDILQPNDGARKCYNCAYWGVSPLDADRGACWNDPAGLIEVKAGDSCGKGLFIAKTAKA